MSKYRRFAADRIRDYPLESRSSKVDVSHFGKPFAGDSFSAFVESLPRILAGSELRCLVDQIVAARQKGRALVWGFGAHVIKVGLAPVLIDLLERGFITALATNGSGVIHDFEIAICGRTSEDVKEGLARGSFGMARETGQWINQAIRRGVAEDKGIGESIGEFLQEAKASYPEMSLALQAYQRGVPLTVHVAIGTDIIHNHPEVCGEALGKGSLIDFQILTHQVSRLHDGGVYLNLGSAVLLPEVFLKAVSMVRNTGNALDHFTTANLDFIQHYRPLQNVVQRPVSDSGRGLALTGHHEIMIPLLAAMLVLRDS